MIVLLAQAAVVAGGRGKDQCRGWASLVQRAHSGFRLAKISLVHVLALCLVLCPV